MRMPRFVLPIAFSLFALLIVACDGDGSSAPATATPAIDDGRPAATEAPTLEPGARLSTVDIVRTLRPSVVQVLTESATLDFLGQPQPAQGIGTGVIIDTEGHIITNNHVVRVAGDPFGDLASRITITLSDGATTSAEVVGADPQTDLAVLKIDASGITPAVLGNSDSLLVGSEVVAMGFALGLEGDPSVTRGVISAKERTLQLPNSNFSLNGLIQTDASINPGNSGGPLVDQTGRVIGINTAIIQGAQNIGFAISINLAKPIIEELIENGKVERSFLGIQLADVTASIARTLGLPSDEGVGVVVVEPGSPADDAGLQPNDIIVGLEDTEIRNSGDLLEALRRYREGTTVTVRFYRDGDAEEVDVDLGSQP